jgi:long-subunit fatty acid transport protein
MKSLQVLGLVFLATVLYSVPAVSQNFDWNITGAGARAEGFGGAFIGVADDATSIVWNPAGLATLERPEASLVTRYISETTEYSYTAFSSSNSSESQSHFSLNFGSLALPLKAGGNNIVVAVAYQRQLDAYVNQKSSSMEYTSEGGANTITPGIGVKLSPMISVGLAANFWLGKYNDTNKDLVALTTTTDDGSFSGTNFVLGGLFDFSSGNSKLPLKIGVSVKTPFDLKIDQTSHVPATGAQATASATVQMPLMFGLGASYQPTENLTLALDYETRAYGSKQISVSVNGTSLGQVDMSASKENLSQIRVGAEYLIVTSTAVIPLRAGYRSVPTLLANYDDFSKSTGQVSGSGFSLGSGYITDKFAIDLTYNSTSYAQTYGTTGNVKYSIGTFSTSVIFYF